MIDAEDTYLITCVLVVGGERCSRSIFDFEIFKECEMRYPARCCRYIFDLACFDYVGMNDAGEYALDFAWFSEKDLYKLQVYHWFTDFIVSSSMYSTMIVKPCH